MGMTPKEFFESFVEGNLEDCQEDPGSVRRAFNAAISASHLADQWHTFNQRHNPNLVSGFKDIGQLVEHLSQATSGAFRDVRSIANAYKHLYTDSSSRHGARSTIDSSGAITSVEQLGGSEVVKVEEEYGDTSSKVVFTRRDGSTLDFLPVLEKVVDYWRSSIA
ncbi:hypothetical protein [Marinobacter sp. LN3S78]|uniref:hypothetical protein n=1 Tax=Marinobacter sp. LN3S78 TaxID=3382300 RepID=UPI00387B966F